MRPNWGKASKEWLLTAYETHEKASGRGTTTDTARCIPVLLESGVLAADGVNPNNHKHRMLAYADKVRIAGADFIVTSGVFVRMPITACSTPMREQLRVPTGIHRIQRVRRAGSATPTLTGAPCPQHPA